MSGYGYQDHNEDTYAKVREGYSNDQQCPTTESIVGDRSDQQGHQHIVFNEAGNEIYNQYRQNH